MLITFEGIDGSGKSTQAKRLYEHLKSIGYKVSLYRGPGSTELAEKIRELILGFEIAPTTAHLLFECAWSSLMWEQILPDLRDGKEVIVDRYIDSTMAYQGYGRVINLCTVNILIHIAISGRKPDITFLLYVPLEMALEWIKGKSTRFEDKDNLRRVRDAYILIAHEQKDRIVMLDGISFNYLLKLLYLKRGKIPVKGA